MKHRLFLSSTFLGLRQERAVVLRVARALGWHAVHFRTTKNLDDRQVLTTIHKEIRKCDLFCNLLASRYGSPVPELPLSYTHFEFALARKLGKPIVSLVSRSSKATAINTEESCVGLDGLKVLRREIVAAVKEGSCVRRYYTSNQTSQDELARIANLALREAEQRILAGTFEKGVLASRGRIQSMFEAVGFARSSQPLRGEFSQYFFDYNLPLLSVDRQLNLFFNEGETSRALYLAFLDSIEWTKSSSTHRIRLLTTNVPLVIQSLNEPQYPNMNVLVLGGSVDRVHHSVKPDSITERMIESGGLRVSPSQRALFVAGVSVPPVSRTAKLATSDAYRLMVRIFSSCGFAGMIFLRAPHCPPSDSVHRMLSFLGGLMDSVPKAIPLGICIAAESASRRALLLKRINEYGFTPITPSYHDFEYQKSYPFLATNRAFENRIGRLIG